MERLFEKVDVGCISCHDLGEAIPALSHKVKSEEEVRVTKHIESLRPEGLKKIRAAPCRSKSRQGQRDSKGDFRPIQGARYQVYSFHTYTHCRSGLARQIGRLENPIQKAIGSKSADLPLFIQFQHVQTNFVHLTLIMGTELVPVLLRPLLSTYIGSFFTLPIIRSGGQTDFEQVIMDLEKDTVGYGIESGSGLGNPETLTVQLQLEAEKCPTAIQ